MRAFLVVRGKRKVYVLFAYHFRDVTKKVGSNRQRYVRSVIDIYQLPVNIKLLIGHVRCLLQF